MEVDIATEVALDLLKRAEQIVGQIPCEECDHSLYLHFDRYGCEYERGDAPGGEGEQGPYGEQALGPCGCKAENLSDDGNAAFLLLRDLRQVRLLREMKI